MCRLVLLFLLQLLEKLHHQLEGSLHAHTDILNLGLSMGFGPQYAREAFSGPRRVLSAIPAFDLHHQIDHDCVQHDTDHQYREQQNV